MFFLPRLTPGSARQAADDYRLASREVAEAHGLMYKCGSSPEKVHALAGRLEIWDSGWLMLRIPNAVVRGLFDALQVIGAELPLGKNGRLRAHCSVMRPEEIQKIGGPDKVTEVGHQFAFNLGPIHVVEPAGWKEMSKVYFCSLTSPQLSALRRSYGLSSQPDDDKKPFHITVAVKRKNVEYENEVSKA